MKATLLRSGAAPYFRLRFEAGATGEPAIEIPCDAAGRVDLDALDEASRNAYFYARLMQRLHPFERTPVAEPTT